jgi:hypothetical protein
MMNDVESLARMQGKAKAEHASLPFRENDPRLEPGH